MRIGYICTECHRYHRITEAMDPCPRQQEREFLNVVGQDKLYDFVTTGWHPQLPAGIRISSSKQWQRVLKRHDLTDDIGIKERVQRRERDVGGKVFAEARHRLRQRIGQTLRRALMDSQRVVVNGR